MVTKSAKIETTPDIVVGSHYFEQRYLYAFATQGELINHVRTQALTDEFARIEKIQADWQALQPKVQQLIQTESGLADKAVPEDLPNEFDQILQKTREDALFKKTFSALPTKFSLVEIDKLVAAQRTVNLGYVKELKKKYAHRKKLKDLIEICVSPTRDMPPIQHLEVTNNTHVFSSPNLDLRFLGAFLKKLTPDDLEFAAMGGLPAAAVVSFVGYGGAPVNIFHVGGRLIINNGFHRVYALRSNGVTKIPVVLQTVNNWQLEVPPQVGGLPREYLLSHPRPVMMKDFFEKDFCITLKAKDRVKIITIQTNAGQFDAPS